MSVKRAETLEDKFIAFGKSLPGAEFIDSLSLTTEQKNSEKADFLLGNRQIVCEIKSLKADMAGKVEKVLSPHEKRTDWPIVRGSVGIDEILKRLPDGEQINKQLYDATTTSIKELVRKANRQIRKTKEVFGLSSAGGLLVLLNDYVEILTPDIIAHKVYELYGKKTLEGDPQFPEINLTWIINEAHFAQLTTELRGLPSFVLPNSVLDPADVAGYVDSLHPPWAAYNNAPLIKMDWNTLPDVKFESVAQERRHAEARRQYQEMWRNEYREHPHMRDLTTEALLQYGERFVGYILPGYSEGASLYEKGRKQRSMRYFTHFLEEANWRGIAVQAFSPELRALAERLKTEGIISNEHFTSHKPSATTGGAKVGRNDPCSCGSGKKYKKCCGSALRPREAESKASSNKSEPMIKEDKQGPVTVTNRGDGTGSVRVNVYALSLAAVRKIDEQNVLFDHAAVIAPPPIDSEDAAKEYGLKEARARWSAEQGWDHRVEVSVIPLTFEFGRSQNP